jgi:Fuc2NAc and GlcNAc transferase
MISTIAALLGATLGASLLTGVVRRYALRSELLDVPNERSLHRTPTPRGGGLAIALVTLAGLAVAAVAGRIPAQVAWTLGTGGALVAAVGWLDDRRGVGAPARIAVHALAAAWAVYWIRGDFDLQAIAAVVWIVWAINLYNFMDGIDGLAGAEAVSVGLVAGVLLLRAGRTDLAVIAFLVAAAAVGFLRWNWPPARVFMGDVGSGFLGFTFGALALVSHRAGAVPLALWLVVLGVFVFDATVTLVRRMLRGERWYQAHRSHAYQRLVQAGSTHAAATNGVLLVNLGLGAIAWQAQTGRLPAAGAVLAGIVVLTVLYLAIERRRPMFGGVSGPTLP